MKVVFLCVLFPYAFSQLNNDVPETLESMSRNFSFAINLTLAGDQEIYISVKRQFQIVLSSYCNHQRYMDPSLLCTVIQGSQKLTSRVIKDCLAGGNRSTLSTEAVGGIVPWREELLEICLKECHFDINKKSCKGLTPLEYSVKTQQYKSGYILIDYNALVTPKTIYYTIANQDKSFLTYLLKRTTTNLTDLINEYSLASIYDWLGFNYNVTKILDIQSGNYYHHLINTSIFLSQVYLSCPLAGKNKYERTACSHCPKEGHLSLPIVKSFGGWLVYEANPQVGLPGCHLPHISAQDLNEDEFWNLLNLRIPFILVDVPYFTELREIWNKHSLEERFSNVDLLAGSIPYGEIFGEDFGVANVAEFLLYMEEYALNPIQFEDAINDKSLLPLYIFDGQIMNEVFKSFFQLPKLYSHWNSSRCYHQFILGPRGSGAPFHFHCSAFNYLAYGRKKWFLYPPALSLYSKIHPLHWYTKTYKILSQNDKPIECIQESNQMLYVPSGWAHATLNIDECIGLATEFDTGDC